MGVGADRIMINPGFSAILRIDTVAGTNITGKEPKIKSNTWYRCRYVYDSDEKTKIKIVSSADTMPRLSLPYTSAA